MTADGPLVNSTCWSLIHSIDGVSWQNHSYSHRSTIHDALTMDNTCTDGAFSIHNWEA